MYYNSKKLTFEKFRHIVPVEFLNVPWPMTSIFKFEKFEEFAAQKGNFAWIKFIK